MERPVSGDAEAGSPLRVVSVDDHPTFRAGLRAVLAVAPDLELVGEAATGREALELAAQLQPDVVVMDVQLPDVDGITATRRLIRDSPSVRVVVVTMFEDDATVFRAMQAGARGYLPKGATSAELLRAVRAVGNGEAVFGAGVAERVLDWFAAAPAPVAPDAFPQLSAREREVLELLAAGRRNQEIAATLFLSPKTVRNLVSSVLTKLQVSDRAQAALRARDAGFGN
jgi:DNA-binding NarL/FixJ family response regulator